MEAGKPRWHCAALAAAAVTVHIIYLFSSVGDWTQSDSFESISPSNVGQRNQFLELSKLNYKQHASNLRNAAKDAARCKHQDVDSGARNECIHLVRARVFLNLYECKSTLAKGWLAAWTAMQCNESSMVASRDIGDFVGKSKRQRRLSEGS